MTTVFYKAVILQQESWCWSFLGLKGLTLTGPLLNWPRGEDEFIITLLSSFSKKKIELIFISLSLQVEMIEDHVQQKGMKANSPETTETDWTLITNMVKFLK